MDNLLKEVCGMLRGPTRNVGCAQTSSRRVPNLLKEVCGMLRDPTRNVGRAQTSGRRVPLLHLSLKEEERN